MRGGDENGVDVERSGAIEKRPNEIGPETPEKTEAASDVREGTRTSRNKPTKKQTEGRQD
ncbi:hypothetical protein [Cohnella thermotolerans]|uniref:hypothetical protein n=1 Tax=Cohnella thermotolerans TaxID=329858 RepID=UPI000404D3DA|nr:hypothetical protein [Cohnella thermotolerans]